MRFGLHLLVQFLKGIGGCLLFYPLLILLPFLAAAVWLIEEHERWERSNHV